MGVLALIMARAIREADKIGRRCAERHFILMPAPTNDLQSGLWTTSSCLKIEGIQR
jgi:hypothetical protein